ncbi:MAG: nucleoside 2-deoxyribosyltransferase [Promethearchaeota archaeon]
MKKTIYLANPLGFSKLLKPCLSNLIEKMKDYCRVLEPFSKNEGLGKDIDNIIANEKDKTMLKQELLEISHKIGRKNQELIDSADLVVAILDGPDVDSGVAAEIGYASAKNKKIFGLRTDFRSAGDNPGLVVNLQVEYFIKASNGKIFTETGDLIDALRDLS